jgi:hypothetical protein
VKSAIMHFFFAPRLRRLLPNRNLLRTTTGQRKILFKQERESCKSDDARTCNARLPNFACVLDSIKLRGRPQRQPTTDSKKSSHKQTFIQHDASRTLNQRFMKQFRPHS